MPYRNLRSNINGRFVEVNNLLNHIKSIEDSITPPALPPMEYKILKGLFYVHLYAWIEFAVNKLVVDTLSLIKSKNIFYTHFENKFHAISLHTNLQGVRDCNSKFFLDKSADIFIQIDSTAVATFDETLISKYIQNVWGKTFNQITKTLGMPIFTIQGRTIAIFDELVNNRNKVAHGRDSAENVGSSPNYIDLKNKYDEVYITVNLFIDHFESYYLSKDFIKVAERANY
jgi:RiboL-PSP-HEPN